MEITPFNLSLPAETTDSLLLWLDDKQDVIIKQTDLLSGTGQSTTGTMTQKAITDAINAGYLYKGVATPATNPGTPDANVFYLASEAGTYTNFGGIVINEGEVCALVWNGTWAKQVTGAATADQLNQLGQKLVVANKSNSDVDNTGWYGEDDVKNASSSYLNWTFYMKPEFKKVFAYVAGEHPYILAYSEESCLGYIDTPSSSTPHWVSLDIPNGTTHIRINSVKIESSVSYVEINIITDADGLKKLINTKANQSDFEILNSNAVKTSEQEFTDVQKEQARSNINAASLASVAELKTHFYVNKFDGYLSKGYWDSTGIHTTNTEVCNTHLIPCTPNTLVTLKNSSTRLQLGISFFDSSQNYISTRTADNVSSFTTTIPENIYYIGFYITANGITPDNTGTVELLLQEDLNYIENDIAKHSLYDVFDGLLSQGYWTANGIQSTSAEVCNTHLYPCLPNTIVVLKNDSVRTQLCLQFFDENKTFLSSATKTINNSSILTTVAPPNACYTSFYITTSHITPSTAGKINIYLQRTLSDVKEEITSGKTKRGLTPMVSYVDDDCATISSITAVKNLCDDIGIKCTFACITSKLSDSDILTALKSFQGEGFDIVSHSHTHTLWYRSWEETPMFTSEECENDLILSLEELAANGFINTKSFITPGDPYTKTGHEDLVQRCAKWVDCLDKRSTGINKYNDSRYDLSRIFIEKDNDIQDYYDLIDNAVLNGDWLIFATHASSSTFDSDYVKNVLNYAINKGIKITTYTEGYRYRESIFKYTEIFEK